MSDLELDTNQLLIIVVVVVIFVVLFMRCNRREGLYATGLMDIHPSGPGLMQDSQGKWCPKHMLQPTLTGAQWPYSPVYYCRDWTGTIDTDPPVVNGCS